jgi:tripartite-type tricarboxylate transporter receptor subunit TctC
MPGREAAMTPSEFALIVSLCGAVAFGAANSVEAQTFPEKRPFALVVPFAPGGGTDAIARDLGRHLQEDLGQSVVIDNKGGGGGVIAAQLVAKAKPDGHTLLFVTSTFITSSAGDKTPPYDVLKDFAPIAYLGRGPMLIVINKDLGLATLGQLIDRARAEPEALNFVSSGPGSVTHLAGELFLQNAGVKMTHIPYKGSGPALLDLIAGRAEVFFATVPTILGQIKADNVRLLATTSARRSSLFPETPTAQEFGIKDYDVGTWWGIVGPAGLPPPTVEALNAAINRAAASETIRKRFAEEGAEPNSGKPEDLARVMNIELATWRKVVREGGLKFD